MISNNHYCWFWYSIWFLPHRHSQSQRKIVLVILVDVFEIYLAVGSKYLQVLYSNHRNHPLNKKDVKEISIQLNARFFHRTITVSYNSLPFLFHSTCLPGTMNPIIHWRQTKFVWLFFCLVIVVLKHWYVCYVTYFLRYNYIKNF